ncbi:hypothetical protein JW979_00855 [bacterium]|nr:hypothetical protein [candidate division CSSED10-310 bacterium]
MRFLKIFVCIICLGSLVVVTPKGQSAEITSEDCFFLSSLHFTTDGMKYWYSKENGGLEKITGVPYDELHCKHCHASSCDACHLEVKVEKKMYTTQAALQPDRCLTCHGREANVMKRDDAANVSDVHRSAGLACMDCHSLKEVHGDGTRYISMRAKEAMDVECENCHEVVSEIKSHKIHNNKLDCKACHVRHVLSCSNCHFDTFYTTQKKVSIPVSDWVFLMNYEGKVTSANMQTFVANGNKTFLMFAPQFSHSVMKEGRKCNDCHGTDIVKQVSKGEVTLLEKKDDAVVNLKGVIPVVDAVNYKCVYQNYVDGKWVPVPDPQSPVVHYAAFGEPLTKEQLKALTTPFEEH